jgi:chemotaxis protein methyltransferase CheR
LSCVSQDPAYGCLKDHFISATGLAFYADQNEPMTELIGKRLSVLGLRDCRSYAELLTDGEAGRAEMDVLIAQLTIGETYFFRDEEQFAAIRDVILPDILERNQFSRQLRIRSAGCATGAEPYSLAILLAREFRDRIDGWRISIHATDLNRGFLTQAAEGKFRAAAFRSTSDQVKRECFSREGLIWTIHPRFKEWISFHQMNLVEREFGAAFPFGTDFDLVVCRNVMIYFSASVNRRLIGQFHQSLREGGWLVVGACESSLRNLALFSAVNAPGARLFQKTALPPTPRIVAPRPVGVPGLPVAPFSEPPPAPILSRPLVADVTGLSQLADRGEWQSAAECAQRLLTENGLNAEIHFYQALILEKLGIADQPARSLRHAIYLDRNFALAHYHLGVALKRDGQTGAAARSFGNVLSVLASLPDLAIVTPGPGVTVTGLKELAKMHLGTAGGA